MGCVWNYFFFRFPITSYNIFHFSSFPLTLVHIASLSYPHTHSITLAPRHISLYSLTPYVRSVSSCLSAPAANSGADGVKAIFRSAALSSPLAIHELSWLRSVYLDWCVQERQWLTECGLTRVSRLIQACGVTGGETEREREREEEGILVYLISRLKEKQVLTSANLFCTAEAEDRLAQFEGTWVKHTLLRNNSARLCALDIYFLWFSSISG